MKIPYWKKLLSYIFPITLEQSGSEHNPSLTVAVASGRLQLLSGNAIYSWDDLYRNFNMALGELSLESRPEAEVLVLGLGLGSIPFILEKVYKRNYNYTLVEWDEAVVELAEKYTLCRLNSSIQVVTADAAVFVEITEEQYDMIIVDIFQDDFTPTAFEQEEFLLACAERLHPEGLLLFNRLHGAYKDKQATKVFFEETFKRLFPSAWKIDTGGNWILCYRK